MLGLEPEDGKEASELGDFGSIQTRVKDQTRVQIGSQGESGQEDENEEEEGSESDDTDESGRDGSDESDVSRGDPQHTKPEDADSGDEEEEDEEDAENERRLKKIQANPDLEKANAALVQELRRLRSENKAQRLRQQYMQQQQPQAPVPNSTTQQQRPPRVLVQLDETGNEAYVPEEALLPVIERAIQQVQRPTPQQLRSAAIQGAVRDFISQDPSHMDIVRRANEVDDYLTQAIDNLRMNGYEIHTLGDAITALKAEGFDQRVIQAYPELDGVFDEFVTNMADDHPAARRLAYMLVKSNTPKQPTPRKRRTPNKQLDSGAKRPLGKQPSSLGRKAGSRSTPNITTTDQREFAELESEFQANIAGFPEQKYRRLKQLADKLQIEGY